MAQMSVPAEPSYKSTSYSGLKGADFSNDPSLVAKNHSPDLVNMISDNGGSPIKRKGWEVTDEANGKIANMWHFQMYGKKWHVAIVQGVSNSTIVEFDNDGAITTLTTLSGWTGKGAGFFFQSNDESKTGFYILANGVHKVKPATDESTELTYYSSLTPTVPTVMEHRKYNGEGGISTQGINMLTRQMTFEMWDDRMDTTVTLNKTDSIVTVAQLQSPYSVYGMSLTANFEVTVDGTKSTRSLDFVRGTSYTQSWTVGNAKFIVAYNGIARFECQTVETDGVTTTRKFVDLNITANAHNFVIFPQNSTMRIDTTKTIQVQLLQEDGSWSSPLDSQYVSVIESDAVPYRRVKISKELDVPGSVSQDNVRITLSATGATGTNKITGCTCSTIYSQMTEGQVFVSGNPDYPQYVWYSDIADPLYFPDTNYLFVGGAGTNVTGMIPFGSQIAVLKEPSLTESTIFLILYEQATDQKIDFNGEQYTETRDMYKVKHGFSGVGSLTADSVFSLSDEPLFLSQKGIMGMVASAINSTNSLKNRSGYLDPKLLKETNLSNAVATVHDNYYILVVNGHAYVLDARQKSSDYKGNTSYLYESYYWDNIPASCIASDGEILWFGTADGRLCRFKNSDRMDDYSDNTRYGDDPIRAYIKDGEIEYSETWLCDVNGDTIVPDRTEKYILMGIRMVNEAGEAEIHRIPDGNTPAAYTVYSWDGTAYTDVYVVSPIRAVWSTPLDNDGATPYFKTMQKKGSGCTLYPFTRSSVDAYLQKDGNDEMYIGSMFIDVENWEDIDFTRFTFIADRAPRDVFFKKKMKKYIRLKIILKNEELDEAFGVQEIFKTYLHTRYAKGSTLVKRSDY